MKVLLLLLFIGGIEAYYNIYSREYTYNDYKRSVWKPYVCILETIAGNTLLADNLLEPKLGFHHCVSDTETINKVWASNEPVFGLKGGRLQYVQINLTDLQVQRINAIKAYVQDHHHRKLEEQADELHRVEASQRKLIPVKEKVITSDRTHSLTRVEEVTFKLERKENSTKNEVIGSKYENFGLNLGFAKVPKLRRV
jgi:hypothetical protein